MYISHPLQWASGIICRFKCESGKHCALGLNSVNSFVGLRHPALQKAYKLEACDGNALTASVNVKNCPTRNSLFMHFS